MQFDWDQAAPGITNAFRMLLANPYAMGQKASADAERLKAKDDAQIAASQAAAEAAQARAAQDNAQTDIINARPNIVAELAALKSGRSLPTLREGRTRLQQGLPAVVYDNGQQSAIDTQAQTDITRALMETLPLLGTETWNPQQIAAAGGEYAGQNRITDMIAGRLDPARVSTAQFAEKGSPRYGVQGNHIIDQLAGVGAPTAVGQSMIDENEAQGRRAEAGRTGADRYQLIPMPDAQGNMTLQRVRVQGAEGQVALPTGVAPAPKRDPNVQLNAEYRAAYPMGPTGNSPSQDEFAAMKQAGKDPVVEFPKIMAAAKKALKSGASLADVQARVKSYGINPARITVE